MWFIDSLQYGQIPSGQPPREGESQPTSATEAEESHVVAEWARCYGLVMGGASSLVPTYNHPSPLTHRPKEALALGTTISKESFVSVETKHARFCTVQ